MANFKSYKYNYYNFHRRKTFHLEISPRLCGQVQFFDLDCITTAEEISFVFSHFGVNKTTSSTLKDNKPLSKMEKIAICRFIGV